MKRVMVLLACGFGLGCSPLASGTAGTLPGVGIAAALSFLAWPWQVLVAALLALLAIPICQAGEDRFGGKDDRRIVADEYLTFPLCVVGLPLLQHPWLFVLAFVTHRVLDILKPPPAMQAQRLRGGLGVAADDIVSGLYALGVNHLVWFGVRALM